MVRIKYLVAYYLAVDPRSAHPADEDAHVRTREGVRYTDRDLEEASKLPCQHAHANANDTGDGSCKNIENFIMW